MNLFFFTKKSITIVVLLMFGVFVSFAGMPANAEDISPFENPDLSVMSITRNPESNYKNQEFTVSVNIRNIGGVEANLAGSHITLAFGTDLEKLKSCSEDCEKQEGVEYYGYYDMGEQLSTLEKNEDGTFTFSSTVFNGGLKAPKAGAYYLYIQLDVNDAITEAKEWNNIYTESFEVVAKTSPFDNDSLSDAQDDEPASGNDDTYLSPFENPDLRITNIRRNPESNYINQKFTAYVYIKNIGAVPVELKGSHLSLAFGTDVQKLPSCSEDCEKQEGVEYYGYYDIGEQLDSLGKNEEKAFRFESTAFNGDLIARTAGTQYLYAVVDTNNAVREAKEYNNTYSASYTTVNKESPFDTKIEDINTKAKLLQEDNLGAILSELKQLRNKVREQQNEIKYLRGLASNLQQVTDAMKDRINNFITYGVDDNTKRLGEGERAAVMYSYKEAFDKLPGTEEEIADSIKIANGRWPVARSEQAESWAKKEFEKIYKRAANMDNANDNAAITVMAYGLRQRAENRNLNSERNGIKIFEGIYGHAPSSTQEWNMMQAITYSGAKR